MALFGLASVSLATIGGVLYKDDRATRALLLVIFGVTAIAETGGMI